MPKGIYLRTERNKKSVSFKEKMRARMLGRNNPFYGKTHTEESIVKIKEANIGKIQTQGARDKRSVKLKGHIVTEETKRKIGEKQQGEKNHNWKGGLTPELLKLRNSPQYSAWRKQVFTRDNFTCLLCGVHFIKGITGSVILHADHIKQFALYPKLRFDIKNGRTLCIHCHRETDTWGGRGNKKLLKLTK